MHPVLMKLAESYREFFTFIEGTELEPNILHSHYLSVRAMIKASTILKPLLQGDVLDVGAGTGFGIRLIHRDARYFPTDIGTARDYRKRSITRRGISLAKECSVYEITYADDRFDGCLALNLFEHLEDPHRALTEIKRVVKPGGMIVLLVPFSFPIHGYPQDYRRWTPVGLMQLLEQHNIEVMHCLPCGKNFHSIILNLNLFIREGMFLVGHTPSKPRLLIYALSRPFMPLLFLLFNLLGLVIGTFDRATTSPIMVCAVGRNLK